MVPPGYNLGYDGRALGGYSRLSGCLTYKTDLGAYTLPGDQISKSGIEVRESINDARGDRNGSQ